MKRGDGYEGECLRPLGCNCPKRTICDYYHSPKTAKFSAVFEDRKVDFEPAVNGADTLGWNCKPGGSCTVDPFGGEDDILTVLQAVNNERASQYGTPEDNFARIARHWQVYLLNAKGLDVEVTPTDVSLLMDLMKTARLENMPGHRDSWVDKAGYARCGAAIEANLARYGRRVKP